MHAEAYEFCRYASNKIGRDIDLSTSDILDVGGRNVNGSVHELFGAASVTTTDIYDDDGVDILADFSLDGVVDSLLLNEKYDVCISTEVLEHAPRWPTIISNMVDTVRSGGWLVITCATTGRPPHSAIDGHYLTDEDNEYYNNVTEQDFINVVEKLDIDLIYINTTTTHCDLQALLRKQ